MSTFATGVIPVNSRPAFCSLAVTYDNSTYWQLFLNVNRYLLCGYCVVVGSVLKLYVSLNSTNLVRSVAECELGVSTTSNSLGRSGSHYLAVEVERSGVRVGCLFLCIDVAQGGCSCISIVYDSCLRQIRVCKHKVVSHVYLLEAIDIIDSCVACTETNVVVAGRDVVDNECLELAIVVGIVYCTVFRQFVGCNLASQCPVGAVGRIVDVEVYTITTSVVVGTSHIHCHLFALGNLKQRCNKLVVRVLAAVSQEVRVVAAFSVALHYLPTSLYIRSLRNLIVVEVDIVL